MPDPNWSLSTKFTVGERRNLPVPTPSVQQAYYLSPESREIRKEYREDRAARIAPLHEEAKVSQAAAIAIARDFLKNGVVLNGGGVLAIPAIVTLFDLDADKMFRALSLVAVGYGLGLVTAWSAVLCAFFTQAHLADQAMHNATIMGYESDAHFYERTWTAEREAETGKLKRKIRQLRLRFVILRYVAIALATISLMAFVFGSWQAYGAIVHGARKAVPTITITSPLVR